MLKRLIEITTLVLLLGWALHAQTFTTLVNFPQNGSPAGLLTQGADGNFYGTSGGSFVLPAAIFKITAGGALSILNSFGTGSSGAYGVVQANDGNFYTVLGTGVLGQIYRITPSGTAMMIHQFASDYSEGYSPAPSPLIVGSDGNLYGANGLGGAANGAGTVYKLTFAGQLNVLYDFTTSGSSGGGPGKLVQGTDGSFYGCANRGGFFGDPDGPNGDGTIFKLTPAGVITTLHTFMGTDGRQSSSPLIQGADGSLYGTTQNGGTNDEGTIFKITSSGAFTVLYNFPPASGAKSGLMQVMDGSLYGTAYGESNTYGIVFRFAPDGTFTAIHTFSRTDGYAPNGVIIGKDGNLYGVTTDGGTNNGGTVYRITLGGVLPSISPNGVASASAFGGFSSVAPGSFIEIYGSSLATDSRNWGGSDFTGVNAPTSLDGTSVSIGGQQAFVAYISPGQVNALVPSNVPTGLQQVTVTNASGISAPFNVNVNAAEPGLLATPTFLVNGTQYAVAFNVDGTYVMPTGAVAGLASHPAAAGDTIVLYGLGFGPVTPSIPAGQLVQQANTLATTFQVFIGGTAATAVYSGLAPNYTGLYQFNIVIPNVASANAVPLTFALGGVNGTQTLNIAVQN